MNARIAREGEIPQALSCGVPPSKVFLNVEKGAELAVNIGSKDRMICHLVTAEKLQFEISDSLGWTEMEFGCWRTTSAKAPITNLRDPVFSGAVCGIRNALR
jgi:hypothetical protein